MRWVFEREEFYSLEEVISCLVGQTGGGTQYPFNSTTIKEFLQVLDYIVSETNPCSLPFVSITENVASVSDLSITFFNKLFQRYEHHYCFALDDIYTNVDNELISATNKFMKKVINILDYTYVRYSTLLDLYENQKEHLLDKLQSSRSGSRSLSHDQANSNTQNSTSLYNDAPQTSDVIATISGNQQATDLTKGQVSDGGETHSTGSDTFSESESHDTLTIMGKLDEIEKQFSNVWRKWLNEFDELFIEEVNY